MKGAIHAHAVNDVKLPAVHPRLGQDAGAFAAMDQEIIRPFEADAGKLWSGGAQRGYKRDAGNKAKAGRIAWRTRIGQEERSVKIAQRRGPIAARIARARRSARRPSARTGRFRPLKHARTGPRWSSRWSRHAHVGTPTALTSMALTLPLPIKNGERGRYVIVSTFTAGHGADEAR